MNGLGQALLVLTCSLAFADDDVRGEQEGHEEHEGREGGGAVVPPVTDAGWLAECGSCHLAYPPGLLPARSWEKLLGDLGHHFGDDASVDEATLQHLRQVAASGAAEVARTPLSSWIVSAARGTTPDRISTLPALRAEHVEELSDARVTTNPQVRSWSNCKACHPNALQGRFSEGELRVPR